MFAIVAIPDKVKDELELEPLGTKPKFWFRDEAGDLCLFKEARPNTGEDWAEKIACELAQLLGLPHAEYNLAEWHGRAGVFCQSFVPEGGHLGRTRCNFFLTEFWMGELPDLPPLLPCRCWS